MGDKECPTCGNTKTPEGCTECDYIEIDYQSLLEEFGSHKKDCFQITPWHCKCGWTQIKRALGID